MALITCIECGEQISSAAKVCVKCGHPIGFIQQSALLENILLDASIDQLNLSVRTFRILYHSGIQTVRDIVACNISQLIQINNMGKKSLEEIISKLKQLGFQLTDDENSSRPLRTERKATKYDWTCERIPEHTDVSKFNYVYSEEEMNSIRQGRIPWSMENKWFCYYESGSLHLYRSWSSKLICRVIFNAESNEHTVIKYYSNEEEKEGLKDIDAPQLIQCLLRYWK